MGEHQNNFFLLCWIKPRVAVNIWWSILSPACSSGTSNISVMSFASLTYLSFDGSFVECNNADADLTSLSVVAGLATDYRRVGTSCDKICSSLKLQAPPPDTAHVYF